MAKTNNYAGLSIKELRESKGLTQAALASKLKVAMNTVSRWESGAYIPNLDQVWKMSEFFKVPIARFFPRNTVNDGEGLNIVNCIYICDGCLDGVGGECHSRGCAWWLCKAPGLPKRDHIILCGGTIQPIDVRNKG